MIILVAQKSSSLGIYVPKKGLVADVLYNRISFLGPQFLKYIPLINNRKKLT